MADIKVCWMSAGVSSFVAGWLVRDSVDAFIYKFPMEVLTSALLNRFAKYGVSYGVLKSECVKIDNLDAMKAKQKHLFGGGLLVSERAAAERAAAETWELSEREREIVVNLTDGEATE